MSRKPMLHSTIEPKWEPMVENADISSGRRHAISRPYKFTRKVKLCKQEIKNQSNTIIIRKSSPKDQEKQPEGDHILLNNQTADNQPPENQPGNPLLRKNQQIEHQPWQDK